MTKSKYFQEEFITGTIDRAIASFAQGVLAVFTAGATGILDINWVQLISVAALSALASIATSFSSPERIVNAQKEKESILIEGITNALSPVEEIKEVDVVERSKIRNPFKEESVEWQSQR